eukprot:m.58657 g.58657  ORF g.58657 m.58657 type:complete len:329 (-) comp12197_c0_seq2:22-1008(-)
MAQAFRHDRQHVAELDPKERFNILTEEYFERRKKELLDRCALCWHAPVFCICSKLRPLALPHRISVLILMHPLEFGNAADSSKILLKALPGSRLFVFGVRAEQDAFLTCLRANKNSVLLFPGDEALTPAQLSTRIIAGASQRTSSKQSTEAGPPHPETRLSTSETSIDHGLSAGTATAAPAATAGDEGDGLDKDPHELSVVVLDGTWRQTRAMRRWLHATEPSLALVRLAAEDLARHSALQTGAFSRPRSQHDRISTTEAVAALLLALGAQEREICALVDMVTVNTAALQAGGGETRAEGQSEDESEEKEGVSGKTEKGRGKKKKTEV